MSPTRDLPTVRCRCSVTDHVTSDTAPMALGTDLRSCGEDLDCDQKAVPKPTLAIRIQPYTVREHQ
ncbi:hypothetical protein ATO6_23910 [Oceanicola sp. 22II-s10i]|nr:hypothetical protein ATO6_23910 [Oceanicola sp. 22II-s10i]